MAKEEKIDFKDPDWSDKVTNFRAAMEQHDKYFEEEIAKSTALPKGLQIGKIFSLNVADGYAFYEIIKINQKTVRIKWRDDLCVDRYHDQVLRGGGSFDKSLISDFVTREDA